jgi:hypothetical protein
MGNGSVSRSARLVSERVLQIVGIGCGVDFFDPLSYVLVSPSDTRSPKNECHRLQLAGKPYLLTGGLTGAAAAARAAATWAPFESPPVST